GGSPRLPFLPFGGTLAARSLGVGGGMDGVAARGGVDTARSGVDTARSGGKGGGIDAEPGRGGAGGGGRSAGSAGGFTLTPLDGLRTTCAGSLRAQTAHCAESSAFSAP